MTIQRVWRYFKNSEDFDILCQPIPNTEQLPSYAAFKLQMDQLAFCWSHTFESHRCSIQHPAERAINNKTSYSELFDKISVAVAERIAPWSRITDLNVKLTSCGVSVETHELAGYSVFEVLKYFPGRLSDDLTKLFLIFQVVDHVCGLHRQCLPHLGLDLQNIFIDETLCLTLGIPDLDALSDFRPLEPSSEREATSVFKETDPFIMTLRWCSRKIRNLDYLMFLNGLAGRRLSDPLNSAVVPWITDFTSPSGTLRDLTKSKYHLSKGEAQLNANYKAPISEGKISDELFHGHMISSIGECGTNVTELVEAMGSIVDEPSTVCLRDDDNISRREVTGSTSQLDVEKPLSIKTWSPLSFQPHHLLDMMPNLAYYTYMARRTPKPTLVRFVRPVYRPHEFASSMSRLYESTPDECIPEFFTDPSVFTSIHPDMPDLSLPSWCPNPDEFIKYHSSLLESESVSSRLHHWIDLTFGYKLIGKAAVEAKNVHLELAGSQSTPRRSGVVCIFRTPHPHRIPESQLVTYFLDKCPFINGPCHSTTDRAEQTKSGMHDADTENPPLLDDAVHVDYRTRIHLPTNYDPLALINSYEGLCRFFASETPKLVQLDLSIGSSETSPVVSMKTLFDRDVEAIACFAVELYTYSVVNYSEADQWNHAKRVKLARHNARLYWDRIPYCLHRGLRLVLQPFVDETQNLLSSARFLPSTSQLLNVLFEFPSYLFDLHMVIQWLSDRRSGQLHPVITRPPFLWGSLAAAFISPPNEMILDMAISSNHISPNVLSLLFPHIRKTAEACPIWLLHSDRLLEFFTSVGGAMAAKNYLLPLFLSLFNAGPLMLLMSQSPGQHPLTVLCSSQFLRSLLTYVGCESFFNYLPIRIASVLLSQTDCTVNTFSEVKIEVGFETLSSMSFTSEDVVVSDANQTEEIGLDMRNLETFNEVIERSDYQRRETCSFNCPVTVDNEDSKPVPSTSSTTNWSPTTGYQEQPPTHMRHCPPSTGLSGLINSNACFEQSTSMSVHIAGKPLVNRNTHTVTSVRNCTVCVSPVATSMDSLFWLAKRIGPLLSARHIVPSLLAALVICYEVEKRIDVIGSRSSDVACSFDKNSLPATNQLVNWPLRGDALAMAILQCLKLLVDLYGVSFVSFVYLPFVRRTVKTVAMTMRVGTLALDASGGSGVCFNENSCTWNARTFGSLVAALTFLHQLITFIPDSLLLDLLQDSLLQDLLTQVIRIVGRHDCSYPGSSRGRRALLYRLIDCIYVLGRRVGFELTRTHMTSLFQMFFALFDRVAYVKGRTNRFRAEINAASEYSVGCPPFVPGHNDTRRPTVREDVAQELYDTFTPELARLAYILFCRLAGGAYMDAYLYNAELIHSLVGSILSLEGDALTLADSIFTSATECVTVGDDFTANKQSSENPWTNASKGPSAPTSCSRCADSDFYLRGAWTDILQQQQDEINEMENRKQCYRYHGIRASSFVGHTGKINCIDVMDTENCFLTGAQDNTVQLWSLTNSYNSNLFPSQTSVQNFGQSTFASPHSKLTTNPTLRSTLSNPAIPSASIAARLVYREHKKSVFASIFLNNYRLIASCDGHLILWDPCTGQKVRGGFGTEAVLTAVTRSACPHGALLCADQRGQLFLIDPRAATRHRVQSLPLASGISFASIVRGGLRMGTKSTSGASKNHDNKIDDPLTRQLYALYSSVRPQSSRSVTFVPNGARTNSAEGTLRHLAACDTSHVLLCGFTSGLMTALDLRQYQVVKAWQGHANTVAQIEHIKPDWFVSAGSRNIALWRSPSDYADCGFVRMVDNLSGCAADRANFPVTQNAFPEVFPASTIESISRLTVCRRDIIVCSTSSGVTSCSLASATGANPSGSSPTLWDAQIRPSLVHLGSSASVLSVGAEHLGVYRFSTNTERLNYTSLGEIPSGFLRGHVTALTCLPHSGLLLAGSSVGALSLLY